MLKKMKMGTKLIGGFLVVALIAAVVGITGIVNIRKVAKADLGLFQDSLVPLPVPCGSQGRTSDSFVSRRGTILAARNAGTNAEIRERDYH